MAKRTKKPKKRGPKELTLRIDDPQAALDKLLKKRVSLPKMFGYDGLPKKPTR
ncbi:MAG: hypothetical protein ACRD2I_10085 [Vicinamibacterales bacterium]